MEVAGPLIGGGDDDDALLSCISDVIQLTVVTVCVTLHLPNIWRIVDSRLYGKVSARCTWL